MALAAIRCGRTLRLIRAFASSTLTSPSTAVLVDSSAGAGLSHLFGSSHFYGLQKPCPPWRHLLARCRSWTQLKDCKHWLITLNFPKDPLPTREEMVDTYVKTLANVLGSEEEAKKKIYALSTTTYTGFQCNIDEATSEKLKEQPLVNWVLPDGYGDPELGIFGGDRYENGVITPDPNPPKPYNERPRKGNYDRMRFDRQRNIRPMERRGNMLSEHQDNRRGDNYNSSSTERRDTMKGDQLHYRPPFEQMQGYEKEKMQPDYRGDPILPIDRRESYQGEQSDILYEVQREAIRREAKPLK